MGKVEDIKKAQKARDKYEKETRKMVGDHFSDLDEIGNKITALQDSRKEKWAVLTAKGFNKKALEDAYTYRNMTEKQRENYDNSYVYGRSIADNPMQHDLFMAEVNARFLIEEENEQEQHLKEA